MINRSKLRTKIRNCFLIRLKGFGRKKIFKNG